MDMHDYSFSVDYHIAVHHTRDVFAPDNGLLAEAMGGTAEQPKRALVYIDAAVATADPGLQQRIAAWFTANEHLGVRLAATPGLVDGGEDAKRDFALIERIGREAVDVGLCRHSYIIVIGGGAVLDAVGLAASLTHRGIRQIRLPTTVLAQADAGLGVKNGINAFGNKNLFGTFTPPWAIINDARFLDLLDDRHRRSGVAEAFKVAIIKDQHFLEWLVALAPVLTARDQDHLSWLVERCGRLHLEHITGAGDPFEQGSSRPLDFGHWTAHRLEVLSRHDLTHGEAVAIGIALDLYYASEIGLIESDDAERLVTALMQVGFHLWHPVLDLRDAHGRRSVMAGLDQFREHLGGDLCLAMPDGLGQRIDIHDLDEDRFERCAARLRKTVARQQARPTTEHDHSHSETVD